MAKLGIYYGLCPLIENKSLLGISEDSEKGMVIVTLGKNIAGRYKISDQKQICCWKTKEKFSSSVIYDKNSSKYLAVFNQSYIKLWDAKEENLDKLKKYKFNQQIYSIFSNNANTFVLLQNGNLYTLENALELRKELNSESIISDSEQINDVIYVIQDNWLYVGLVVKSADEYILYWTKYNSSKCKFIKLKLQRITFNLRGYVFHLMENAVHLLTLWSDGRMFSFPLEDGEEITFPGELFTVIEYISKKYTVSMLALDENYLAMCGANSNEEGAILVMYNKQFKVTQSKQSFKLFTNNAKMWSIENNLFVPVGQHLAVVPFYLETEQLAALVGSHKVIQNEINDITIVEEFEVTSWENKLKLKDLLIPEQLTFKISDLLKQGLPESIIVRELLFSMFKEPNIDILSLCLSYFYDLPEKYLAKFLKYVVVLDGNTFPDQTKCLLKSFPYNLQPISRSKLIDQILCKPFSENLLLPYLRSEFTLADVVTLLNYICFLWSEDGHLLPEYNVVQTHTKLIEWSFLLIDANFQKLLLCKDDCVIKVLNQLNMLVECYMNSFEDLNVLSSIINYLKNNKSCNSGIGNVKYSVEQIRFY